MRGFAVTFDYCDGKTHPCIWDVSETGTIYEWDPATMKFVKNEAATDATYPTHFVDASKPSTQPKDVTTIPPGSDITPARKLHDSITGNRSETYVSEVIGGNYGYCIARRPIIVR